MERDIVYSEVDGEQLMLDAAIPEEGKGLLPAIVFIHGGAWGAAGVRMEHWPEMQEAVKRGYVAVTVDYRFPERGAPEEPWKPGFPAQVIDVRNAVRWLRDNAETLRIDPDRIGAYGPGTGGTLALMLGLLNDEELLDEAEEASGHSAKVQAVVHAGGRIDLKKTLLLAQTDPEAVSMRFEEYLRRYVPGEGEEFQELLRAASPISYVDSGDAPVLTLQGKQNLWAPLKIAEEFDRAMRRAGVEHTLVVREDVGHLDDFLWDMGEEFPVWSFFEAHLKP